MTNDQGRKNDQIRMSKRALGQPAVFGHCCLELLWSFGIRILSFACRAPLRTWLRLPHTHLHAVVQLAQSAGGERLARIESRQNRLPAVLHPADLDLAAVRDAVLQDKNLGHSRKSAH